MNILLVEDEPAALELLRKGLELSFPTFTIQTATSAEHAEEHIAGGFVPNLVITDVRLPRRSGVDLLVSLQTQFPNLSFILTSGYTSPKLPQQAGDRVLRFLAKPFELSQLVSEVQAAFVRDEFSSSHRAINFIDILQVLNMSRRTALVELKRDGETVGTIYLVGGEVHHATCGDLEGEAAFNKLCETPDLNFKVRQRQEPPKRSLDSTFGSLLINNVLDEA